MAAGHPVQPEPGEVTLPGGLGRGPGRQAADPAVPAHQHVQVAIHRDELEQPGRAGPNAASKVSTLKAGAGPA